MDGIEEILVTIRESFVYRVPPLKSSRGYVATEWGLEEPIRTCALRVVATGNAIRLRFVDANGALFCESAPIPMEKVDEQTISRYLIPCADSSRYFVVKVKNPQTGREAFLGFGFRERNSAFDMHAAIQDCVRKARRISSAPPAQPPAPPSEPAPSPVVDAPTRTDREADLGAAVSWRAEAPRTRPVVLLPPPPPGAKVDEGDDREDAPEEEEDEEHAGKGTRREKKKEAEDDEWGDFRAAEPSAPAESGGAGQEWGDFQ